MCTRSAVDLQPVDRRRQRHDTKLDIGLYQAFNPAMAHAEHVFSIAMLDVMNNGMTSEQAVNKAFKRAEEIFSKYPITQA